MINNTLAHLEMRSDVQNPELPLQCSSSQCPTPIKGTFNQYVWGFPEYYVYVRC